MKLILHIGMPKTGSTLIQESLRKLHGDLKAAGIFYPLVKGTGSAHKHLSLLCEGTEPTPSLRDRYCDDRRGYAGVGKDYVDALIGKIEARPKGIHTVVLSAEVLFNRPGFGGNADFARLIAGFEQFQVMCYVRQPSANYLYGLQQKLMSDPCLRPLTRVPYKAVLEQVGSRHEILVRKYARHALAGGDVVQDFAQNVLGIKLPAGFKSPIANASFSSAGMMLLREWRARQPEACWGVFDGSFRAFERRLSAAEAALGSAPRPRLNDAVAGWLDAPGEDLCYLRDRFGIDLVDEAPDVPAEKPLVTDNTPLEAVIEVDHARVEELRKLIGVSPARRGALPPGRKSVAVQSPKRRAKADRIAVVVLGMHRSGTSALAGTLALLGCDVPKKLMPETAANKKGYFESQKVYELHDEILGSAGTTWDDWTEFDPNWLQSPKADAFRARALDILKDDFGQSRLFVLKDPRICRLAPFWIETLHALGAEPRIVLTHRNPIEVAASVNDRNQFDPQFGVLLWLRHVLDAEASTRGLRRHFTSYDALMQDWSAVTVGIEKRLGLNFPRRNKRTAAEVEEFLTPSMKHFRADLDEVLKKSRHSPWVFNTYAVLEGWAERSENKADYPVLDEIRAQLNAAVPAFDALVQDGQRVRAQFDTLDAIEALALELNAPAGADRSDRGKDGADRTAARLGTTSFGDRLDLVMATLAKCKAEAEQARKKIAALNVRVEAQQVELKEKSDEARAQSGRASAAENSYAAIQKSTSWRVTAPLRRISMLLRNGRSDGS